MPQESQLRIIAAASAKEQTSVLNTHKAKKGQPNVSWWDVARALEKRRMFATNAKFRPDEEQAFGIIWEDDLFAPADEDSRYTTNVEAFLAAQTVNSLPISTPLSRPIPTPPERLDLSS